MLQALIILLVVVFIVLPLLGMAIWSLLSAAFIGVVIGALARLVVPNSRGLGLLPTIVLGLIGSVVGGFIGDTLIDTNGFFTVLLEIGTAAVAIVIFIRYRDQRPSLNA